MAVETISAHSGTVEQARLVAFDAETYQQIAAQLNG